MLLEDIDNFKNILWSFVLLCLVYFIWSKIYFHLKVMLISVPLLGFFIRDEWFYVGLINKNEMFILILSIDLN